MCLSVVLGMSWLFAGPEFLGVMSGARYGGIVIHGNTDTPRRVIRDLLDIDQGGKIELGKLHAARTRLRACHTLKYDPERGIEPTVVLEQDPNSEFWDVVVTVVDRPGSWLGYCVVDVCWYSVTWVVFRDQIAGLEALGTMNYIVERLDR